jgi:hypothetical protein
MLRLGLALDTVPRLCSRIPAETASATRAQPTVRANLLSANRNTWNPSKYGAYPFLVLGRPLSLPHTPRPFCVFGDS